MARSVCSINHRISLINKVIHLKLRLKGALCPFFISVGFWFLTSVISLSWAFDISFSDSYISKISKEYGDYAGKRLKGWENVVKENQGKTEDEKLEAVNNYMNQMQFYSDISHWGKPDYWATPLEFIVSGGGDCEDFSIAKYYTLLALGVPDKKLLITYVKAIDINQAHMVLTYYSTPESIPLVLDNLNKEILPANKRPDLLPVYGFNGTGLWQAKELGLGNKVGDSGDLKHWSGLQERMQSGKIGKFISFE